MGHSWLCVCVTSDHLLAALVCLATSGPRQNAGHGPAADVFVPFGKRAGLLRKLSALVLCSSRTFTLLLLLLLVCHFSSAAAGWLASYRTGGCLFNGSLKSNPRPPTAAPVETCRQEWGAPHAWRLIGASSAKNNGRPPPLGCCCRRHRRRRKSFRGARGLVR